MKKLFTTAVLALFLSISINAQEKIYFDENWEKTTQDKMEFYRETAAKGKLTLIKDFYKNGKLQMEGLASDPTPGSEVYDGKVTWYNPEGKINSTATFSGGKQVGPSQTFDDKGRPLEDLVYSADGNFKGKSYMYKNIENESYFNSYTVYESSTESRTIVYDNDIKGIRYETVTDKDGNSETKYYGENGKYIGTSSSKNTDNNLLVEYYPNPMRVSKIEKYKNDGSIKEVVIYGKNGKILQEQKMNKKDGYKTTYDGNGNKVAHLTYTYDKDSDSLIPQEGEDHQFINDYSLVSLINVYKNSSLVLNRFFDENGKLSSEKIIKDDVTQEIKYYTPDGNLKSNITYKDDLPYNGILYEGVTEEHYKNGLLVLSKFFWDDNTLRSEKKLNAKQDGYDSTVYNEKGTLLFAYSQPLEEPEGFTAQVVQYAKGKAVNKSVFKDGILQSGKIKVKGEQGIKELERSGKWIIVKVYNADGQLIQDAKVLADNEESDIFTVIQTRMHEQYLLDGFD
ncbi:membrane-binding protein [Chryseobacterium shigense]|uniref:Antitoxin component YwqK of YwqJK toxin-antitoxin module n=1 Tax=Chryseobacterium shigense TaxID=297244 RepID=A0A841N2K7_9FLAO|nr:membrane-binding protein [Chryseobacterium shigense]MBB6369383.1 antitoxin component YwqK of YwqJK toxin-antitoxin module [Chryseobacterium shigense]